MAKQHVHPTRAKADLVVTGDDDISNEVSLVMTHILDNAGGSTPR